MKPTFAILPVVSNIDIGSFLDQNQEKDLFLPRSEQTGPLDIDEKIVIAIYNDKEERPCASMRLDRFTDKETSALKIEQQVDIIIYDQTDLGYKALINQQFAGLLYKNEIFEDLHYTQQLKAYVKAIRPDGKVDLILQAFGNKGADGLGLKIIEALEDNNGFLPITDKTAAETIYKMFQVSKKKYKIALGGIYKKRLITMTDEGITLVKV